MNEYTFNFVLCRDSVFIRHIYKHQQAYILATNVTTLAAYTPKKEFINVIATVEC